ncbi:hypothetical protein BJ166DRAFT_242050 [Pestalotiopsis sp. NC0098]|nr:hypothetical protein BJ166DRAFT_242050 [Pestalotiopsis sp. NC0098]
MPAQTPGRDEEARTTTFSTKTSQGKWPSNVKTHEQAPPGSWAALPKSNMLETDPSSIIPVPVDRSSIYHYSCGQVHAPEDCRGPLNRGCISSCVFCGHTDHMTDHCLYIQLMPKNQHEVLRYYLHVYARQGLPPVASYISFENYKIGPGELSTIPVLSRFAARDYEWQQRESERTSARKPYWQTFDYSRIDTENELDGLPGKPCPSLGRWATRGPLPLRESEIEEHYDERDYNKVQGWTQYNRWWTLFSNDHIPGPLPRQRVILPPWVIDHTGPKAGPIQRRTRRPKAATDTGVEWSGIGRSTRCPSRQWSSRHANW